MITRTILSKEIQLKKQLDQKAVAGFDKIHGT